MARETPKPVAAAVAAAATRAGKPSRGRRKGRPSDVFGGELRRRDVSITRAGRAEYRRLVEELEPFLDSVIRSVTLIKREIYGHGGPRG